MDDKKEAVVTTPLSENNVLTTEKIRTSEEVDKGTKKLEYMKYAVVTICRKDSDKFDGQSKGSTGSFNIDNEFLKIQISTLKPDFY